ncbi:hypothetical protein ALT_8993 [Aspergillus lentulus]|uniref:2EXR domain-containing protein n=1 Tax=Aspergillus lentulus TaxID=293939 RepID=A0AAN4TEU4_ASPLE|nr:uncharacterized protein IFM58399_08900 [Aspergillus lentulus]KAF4155082.1 hypothetical protein CNMCM6069_008489 [Aspergillus lentulus]KAF4162528.1 hypothetical protein CNMCM6936_002010 [Aspergillus lentulus]KAF4174415.1 hypothetical protein CNMCM8060_008637 [Aspergillus lentulus]KAF4193311.1 hypothetical protein CNMCM8694_009012 [Aspergillus lentulus]GAQ11672.1 hypothetical protein ALT_8993 [Aspergillus lentulus]
MSDFHYFPMLPAEIRLHIWNLSLPTSRVIRIICDRGIKPNSRRYARGFRANHPNPVQLQVNREAREEALREFVPYFRTEESPHACIYLAPERDTVHLAEAVLAYLGEDERDALQRMIIDVHDYLMFETYGLESLGCMQRLKEVDLIVSQTPVASYHRRDIVEVIKDAFEEYVRHHPQWHIPHVRVLSALGKQMGSFTVELAEVETLPPSVLVDGYAE